VVGRPSRIFREKSGSFPIAWALGLMWLHFLERLVEPADRGLAVVGVFKVGGRGIPPADAHSNRFARVQTE